MRHLHTLNGTAITSSRTLIAVLETHQRSDGSVDIPEVLQGFGAPAEDPARRRSASSRFDASAIGSRRRSGRAGAAAGARA